MEYTPYDRIQARNTYCSSSVVSRKLIPTKSLFRGLI